MVPEFLAHADLNRDLVAVSLSAPPGRDDRVTVMFAARDWCAAVHTADGVGSGAWLARDRRDIEGDAGNHVYGLMSVDRNRRAAAIDEWVRLTGASRAGIRVRSVRGWSDYGAGQNEGYLRAQLGNVLRYALKDLPRGDVRDLDDDVASSGTLAEAWSVFRAELRGNDDPANRTVAALRQSVPSATCSECKRPLVGRRRQTKTCSPKCRKKRWAREHGRKP
ncbi:MAG: hypothetical protein KF850_34435 [Labilithrix sp.]|nr:hypothetical protein [Labilithrix sp.]MBX3217179.1 hypothetical protein [Labilithrix sp.]